MTKLVSRVCRPWTGKEILLLRAAFERGEPRKVIARALNRSKDSIVGKAGDLQLLRRNYRRSRLLTHKFSTVVTEQVASEMMKAKELPAEFIRQAIEEKLERTRMAGGQTHD